MFQITDLGTAPGICVIVQGLVAGAKAVWPKMAGGCTVILALVLGQAFSLGFTAFYVGDTSAKGLFEAFVRAVIGAGSAAGIAWAVRAPQRNGNGAPKPP